MSAVPPPNLRDTLARLHTLADYLYSTVEAMEDAGAVEGIVTRAILENHAMTLARSCTELEIYIERC